MALASCCIPVAKGLKCDARLPDASGSRDANVALAVRITESILDSLDKIAALSIRAEPNAVLRHGKSLVNGFETRRQTPEVLGDDCRVATCPLRYDFGITHCDAGILDAFFAQRFADSLFALIHLVAL